MHGIFGDRRQCYPDAFRSIEQKFIWFEIVSRTGMCSPVLFQMPVSYVYDTIFATGIIVKNVNYSALAKKKAESVIRKLTVTTDTETNRMIVDSS